MEQNRLDLRETAAELDEKTFQDFWELIPAGKTFPLTDGTSCCILSRGNRNRGKGPDFLDAVIRVGNSERRGDIEIHRKTSHWMQHGHSGDPAYGNVILHVVGENDTTPGNVPFLPCIPVLILSIPTHNAVPSDGRMKDTFCADFFSCFADKDVLRFAEAAGVTRLRGKSDLFLASAIRLGTEKTFFLRLMELLGLPGSRESFRTLGERVSSYPDSVRQTGFSALLWGESGLLPDPAATVLASEVQAKVHALWNEWWKLRRKAEIPLVYHPARPLDSPERKIAYAAALMTHLLPDPMEKLLSHWAQNRQSELFAERMAKIFQVNDPFWENRSGFTQDPLKDKKALAGPDRINLLLTDLVIPMMHAVLRLKKQEDFLPALEQCFTALPANPDNGILRKMRQRCFPGRKNIFHSAASQQGLIQMDREFCSPNAFQCKKCPFRNSLEISGE